MPNVINSIRQTTDKTAFELDIDKLGVRERIDRRGYVVTLSPADMLLIADRFYGVKEIGRTA